MDKPSNPATITREEEREVVRHSYLTLALSVMGFSAATPPFPHPYILEMLFSGDAIMSVITCTGSGYNAAQTHFGHLHSPTQVHLHTGRDLGIPKYWTRSMVPEVVWFMHLA